MARDNHNTYKFHSHFVPSYDDFFVNILCISFCTVAWEMKNLNGNNFGIYLSLGTNFEKTSLKNEYKITRKIVTVKPWLNVGR